MNKPVPKTALSLDAQRVKRCLATSVKQYQVKVVTPMYGGGVSAGEVDRAMPVRATAIRGQLRFFWRLAHRSNFKDANSKKIDSRKMFKAEREIFGGLGEVDDLAASRLKVRVRDVVQLTTDAAATYERQPDGRYRTTPKWQAWAGGAAAAYALFPAQGKVSGMNIEAQPKKLARPGLTFTLEIDDSALNESQREEVETALRWWASFGGVGARTRRGLGAVWVKHLEVVRQEELGGEMRLVFMNDGDDARSSAPEPMECWTKALAALRDFRQAAGFARNEGQQANRPGRSRWPEADAIRRLTEQHHANHVPAHKAGNWFPRAVFGLPIIFHFKDQRGSFNAQSPHGGRQKAQGGDPPDATLKPKNKERMASPYILRPYWDGRRWHPALLRLPIDEAIRSLELVVNENQTHEVKVWPQQQQEISSVFKRIRPLQDVADRMEKYANAPCKPLVTAAFEAFFQGYRKHFSPGR